MGKKRIMVVDDEADLREILTFNLENEGYDVISAASGEEAIESYSDNIDLILLDIMMSGISGLKVAERLRKDKNTNVPIIFLTAKVSENDMLTGFSIGADDYITKPFSVKEVLARCKAVLKRSEMSDKREIEMPSIIIDDIDINRSDMSVRVSGELIPLTKKEYEILLLLASNFGRTFSREDILSKVWRDESYVLERTVDVHITRLRKKLGSSGQLIVNRSGYGYSINK